MQLHKKQNRRRGSNDVCWDFMNGGRQARLMKGMVLRVKKLKWAILFLAVAVCIAVYANWDWIQKSFRGESGIDTGKIFVSDNPGTASYFENARYTRQKTRDEAISVLNSILSNVNADEEAKKAASEDINNYAVSSEKESKIENLVASKGFTDCVAFVGEDNASLVVKVDERGLSSAQASQITDIIVSETGFKTDVIKIIEMTES